MSSSAMAAAAGDDDDWVDVAEEFCGAEEWVVLVGDEGSMAAVFFGRAAAGIGASVGAPIPIAGPADATAGCRGRVLLSNVGAAPPPPDDAIASSRGRVLLSGPWSRYYVLDPSAGERHALPRPRRANPRDAAITCSPCGPGYWVVCAFADCFEIYASSTGKWREVPTERASDLVPGSAASFLAFVFWKRAGIPGVIALNADSGFVRDIDPPPRCSAPTAPWQLGVAASYLCAAVPMVDGVELYGLDGELAWNWKLLQGTCGVNMDGVRLLRFESDAYEVLLRIGGQRVVALDIVQGTTREARLEGAVLPEKDEKIVPWFRPTSTLLF